jgi:molecular chaperone GrpE
MATGKKTKDKDVEELRNQLARALADYDNLEKRVAREREEFLKESFRKVVVKFLPIYDMLLAAQKHLDDTGVAITINAFEQVLSDEGVDLIKPKVGEKFDESICEAVEVEETEDKNKVGTIAEVILPGWKFRDGGVIRYSKVKVFREKN